MKYHVGQKKEIKVKMWGIKCAMDYKVKHRIRAKFYIKRKFALEKAKENNSQVVPVTVSYKVPVIKLKKVKP